MTDASHLQSLLERGDDRARSGDPAGAVASYDELLSLEPGHLTALERKAAALLMAGDFEGALRCHTELVSREPEVSARHIARSQVLSHSGRYAEAIADLET